MRRILQSLSYPRFLLLACGGATVLGLSLFLRDEAPVRDPLQAVRSAQPLSGFDEAYWASLARQAPEQWQRSLVYCSHPPAGQRHPNCQALLRAAWSGELQRSAAQADRYLSSPSRTAFASSERP